MSLQDFFNKCSQIRDENNLPPLTMTGNSSEILPKNILFNANISPHKIENSQCFYTISYTIPGTQDMAKNLAICKGKFDLGQTKIYRSITIDSRMTDQNQSEIKNALGKIASCIENAQKIFVSNSIDGAIKNLNSTIATATQAMEPLLNHPNLNEWAAAAGIKICGKIIANLKNFAEDFKRPEKALQHTLSLRVACKQLRELDLDIDNNPTLPRGSAYVS